MPGTDADLTTKALFEIARQFPIDQIACTLLDREADHNPQPVSLGGIEKRARRHRMWNPNSVDAKSRHLGKIALYQLIICILAAALVRPERAVGDAAHEEGLAVN